MSRCASFALLAAVLVLPGCDADEPSAPEGAADPGVPLGKADGIDAPLSVIEFDANFSAPVATPALVAGGQVQIGYDPQRFYEVFDGPGYYGWFASSFHCYGYGCCEVTIPEVSAHARFDGGEILTTDVADGAAALAIPEDAESLELWFSAPGFQLRTWYCGCDAACAAQNYAAATPQWHDREGWDSAWGSNYHFAITSGDFSVVHGQTVKLVTATHDGEVLTGEIEVANLAYAKAVRVHYAILGDDGSEGPWQDLEASFLGMADGDDFERWSFALNDPALVGHVVRFALRYDAADHTHWDNNCGWNYQAAPGGEVIAGHDCD